jgi:hypothetical protein
MKRRDFLKNAGAAIVPAALPAALWASTSSADSSEVARMNARSIAHEQISVTAVLYDERYTDCRAFADALERHGAKAFATHQDAVALWYGPLRAHLEKNPGRVAGLATYADFSSSIVCARELACSLRFEGHHDARRHRTTVTHRLTTRPAAGPASVALANPYDIASALKTSEWAAQLAEALWRMPEPIPANRIGVDISRAKKCPSSLPAQTQTPGSASHSTYLNSWLLATAPVGA